MWERRLPSQKRDGQKASFPLKRAYRGNFLTDRIYLGRVSQEENFARRPGLRY